MWSRGLVRRSHVSLSANGFVANAFTIGHRWPADLTAQLGQSGSGSPAASAISDLRLLSSSSILFSSSRQPLIQYFCFY